MTRKKDVKFFIKIFVPLLFVMIIIGYGYFRAKDLIQGVQITIYEPRNNSTFTESLFEIKGKITKSSAVYINDWKIFLDENGDFKEKLLFFPGYNIITVRTEDRFKRVTENKLELVYNQNINR